MKCDGTLNGQQYFFSSDLSMLEDHCEGILLMLDFDGTLVPIIDDPVKCYLSSEVKQYLSMISRTKGFTVAVISGRSLSDIKKRVALRGLYYSGSHGLEISGPTINFVHADVYRIKPSIDKLRSLVEKEMRDTEGLIIEKKRFSFSCHYRMVKKGNVGKAIKKLLAFLSQTFAREDVTILRGKKVIEVIPRIPWNKGKAARLIINHLQNKPMPVYAGDDTTDEFAFRALRNLGLTVRICRSDRSSASYYLREQAEIVPFLAYLYNMRNIIAPKGWNS